MGVNQWLPGVIHAGGKNVGEGIQFSGPGNVECYNKVIGFRDCISIMENRYAEKQSCIDIYNNDIYLSMITTRALPRIWVRMSRDSLFLITGHAGC